MTVYLLIGGSLLVLAIAIGGALDFLAWLRPRRQLAAAFRDGRATVPHLPTVPRPVEAWPVFVAVAGEAA